MAIFIRRHQEESRLKLYELDNGSFPIPSTYVDVMRQTQTSINFVCEQRTNDTWTEAKGVNLSEEWTGTTRFQILRTRLPDRHKWVNGRPQKIQETTRLDRKWPESWTQLTKKQKENYIAKWAEQSAKLQAARRNRGIYEVLTNSKDQFKVIADARLKLEKSYCSCCAVHCEGRRSRISERSDGTLTWSKSHLMRGLHCYQWCQHRTVR